MLNIEQRDLLLNTPEDEFHDFKQKWHHSKSELVRDILNFVNTSHHEDCYIIFGIDNITLDIIGVNNDDNRRNEEDLTDLLHKLFISTNNQIKISIQTETIDNKEIDILIIHDTDKVPVFLTKDYKPKKDTALPKGLIYARNGSINTPKDSSAPFELINKLFQKFNHTDLNIKEQYFHVLKDYKNWFFIENEDGRFFIYNPNPDFYIKLTDDDSNRFETMPYSLNQYQTNVDWQLVQLRYQHLTIIDFMALYLDQGNCLVPSPDLESFECGYSDTIYYHCLYKNTLKYQLLKVFSSISGLEKYPLDRFKNNIVIYDDKIELENTHNLIKSKFSTEEIMKQLAVSKKDLNLYYKKAKQKNPDYNSQENEKNLTELNLIKLLKSFQKSKS
ncbi:TPA: ATP-binding protein [Streptococcus agalactiae]|uniref:ATP-binding protein n=1 Tax=Streptococcus milleri TaxID=33040 RepID=UPI000F6E3B30|nr:ATP-binding protein [Streptococcus milleri]HEN3172181.1 ATP-binding protein [Streptococcus agalactiae]VEE82427.1 Abi-alpha protein [Streptococcus milleri]HEN4424563.1 ATP-binding protein [Streptococcus agalactiae]HEN6181605.1 ATP-binding protein [Streptococcus agalactiae]HEN7482988.1 ATP-binding protein [Streptococcus agalactiae]